jgi:hypothetical protein
MRINLDENNQLLTLKINNFLTLVRLAEVLWWDMRDIPFGVLL